MNPTNTVFDAKRLIGRNISDPVIQNDLKHGHLVLLEKMASVLLKQNLREKKQFQAEEISSMVLTKDETDS